MQGACLPKSTFPQETVSAIICDADLDGGRVDLPALQAGGLLQLRSDGRPAACNGDALQACTNSHVVRVIFLGYSIQDTIHIRAQLEVAGK